MKKKNIATILDFNKHVKQKQAEKAAKDVDPKYFHVDQDGKIISYKSAVERTQAIKRLLDLTNELHYSNNSTPPTKPPSKPGLKAVPTPDSKPKQP